MRSISFTILVLGSLALAVSGRCEPPRNILGAHLLTANTGQRGVSHLKWARSLVGRYGYVKTLMMGITKDAQGPQPGWVDWVNACYKMDLIPVCRLAGVYSDAIDGWVKPEAEADGRYCSMAEAVKRVVEGLPRSEKYPIYIEVWNEPNLDVEWSGKANVAEYARFFVDASKAIRSIGDSRIKVMNGAFGLSPKSTEICCQVEPEFVNAFDVWASHPYPQNQPPEFNNHNGTAIHNKLSIDGYLMETEVLRKYGRRDIKVMITETGYALGETVFSDSYGFPPVDEHNRADYMLRAYRDYWEKWPELVAVIPFEFADRGWERFNWVHPDSGTRIDGSPTKPHYQYVMVSRLAKPSDAFGTVSGKVRDARYGACIEDVNVCVAGTSLSAGTDAMGNYILPRMKQGSYQLAARKRGFVRAQAVARVRPGGNAVADFRLTAGTTGSLSGKVLDGVSGAPVRGAVVSLAPGGAKMTTDGNGRFRLLNLPPIAYNVEASLAGYCSHKVTGLTVAPASEMRRTFRIARSLWPGAKNECSNPSFEIITTSEGKNPVAARWEVQAGEGAFSLARNVSHSGDACQAVRAAPGRDLAVRMISHYNYAKPGSTYTAGVWVKTVGVIKGSGEGAYLSLDFQDNGGKNLQSISSQGKVAGTGGWTYLQASGPAPQCQRISVVIHLKAERGVAYFDDAYLGLTPG